jgi:hypothetical protein
LTGRNFSSTSAKSVVANQVYESSCKTSSSRSGATIGIGSEEVVKLASSVFSLTGSTSKEKLQSFCSQYESSEYYNQSQSEITSTVVKQAILSWAACQRNKSENVVFNVLDEGSQFTVTVKQGKGIPVGLQGVVYDNSLMSCKVFHGETTESANDATKVTISNGKLVSVICTRNSTIKDDQKFFPLAALTIPTGEGTISIEIPEKSSPNIRWLKDVDAQINALQSDFNTETDRLEKLIEESNSSNIGFNEIAIGWLVPTIVPNDDLRADLPIGYQSKATGIGSRGEVYSPNFTSYTNTSDLFNLDGRSSIEWFSLATGEPFDFKSSTGYNIFMTTNYKTIVLGKNLKAGEKHEEIIFADYLPFNGFVKPVSLIAVKSTTQN